MELLINNLNDFDEEVLVNAAWALGEIGLEEAIPELWAVASGFVFVDSPILYENDYLMYFPKLKKESWTALKKFGILATNVEANYRTYNYFVNSKEISWRSNGGIAFTFIEQFEPKIAHNLIMRILNEPTGPEQIAQHIIGGLEIYKIEDVLSQIFGKSDIEKSVAYLAKSLGIEEMEKMEFNVLLELPLIKNKYYASVIGCKLFKEGLKEKAYPYLIKGAQKEIGISYIERKACSQTSYKNKKKETKYMERVVHHLISYKDKSVEVFKLLSKIEFLETTIIQIIEKELKNIPKEEMTIFVKAIVKENKKLFLNVGFTLYKSGRKDEAYYYLKKGLKSIGKKTENRYLQEKAKAYLLTYKE